MPGFGSVPVNDSHFNMDGLLNVNHYADIDSNPYVVGSAAYNYAHGMPALGKESQFLAGSNRTPNAPSAGAVVVTTSDLLWWVLIAVGGILLVSK
jgi:hypothetical protein